MLIPRIEHFQQRSPIFVHLDLKSYNLLYPNRDFNRRSYIIDFDDLLIGDPLLALAVCFGDFPTQYRDRRIEEMEKEGFLSHDFPRDWREDIRFYRKLIIFVISPV